LLSLIVSQSWRDIQGVLASTSRKVDLDSDSWATNAAGFQHSYKYGFGVVHAQDAVAAAETWTLWAPEVSLAAESVVALNLQIPTAEETNLPLETSLNIRSAPEAQFEVESVVVWLSIDHPSRGDLTIVLTSPQNTQSILHESPRPENTHPGKGTYWEFMTVRAWGERPDGNWTLSILDERPGNLRDTCVDMPWLFLLSASPQAPSGAIVTCGSIGRTLLVDPNSQLTPDKACCVCGGGMPPTQNAQLNDWKLIVYGRGATPVETEEEEEGGESSPPATIENDIGTGNAEGNQSTANEDDSNEGDSNEGSAKEDATSSKADPLSFITERWKGMVLLSVLLTML
jgi:hypothetical protein